MHSTIRAGLGISALAATATVPPGIFTLLFFIAACAALIPPIADWFDREDDPC
jgi:hypothetical protein